MKNLAVSLLILISIAGLNCAPADGPIPNQPVIMALAVGNEWIGQINEYDLHGKLDSTWLDTLRVLQSKVIGEETWYYKNIIAFFGPDTNHSWFTNRSDGLYTCDSEHFDQAYRCCKFPANPGDVCVTFENTFDSTGMYGSYSGISVDTTNVQVAVPAGKFRCYVYRGVSYTRDWDVMMSAAEPGQYFAPGIGEIQFGYFDEDGKHDSIPGPDRTWQLVRAILH